MKFMIFVKALSPDIEARLATTSFDVADEETDGLKWRPVND